MPFSLLSLPSDQTDSSFLYYPGWRVSGTERERVGEIHCMVYLSLILYPDIINWDICWSVIFSLTTCLWVVCVHQQEVETEMYASTTSHHQFGNRQMRKWEKITRIGKGHQIQTFTTFISEHCLLIKDHIRTNSLPYWICHTIFLRQHEMALTTVLVRLCKAIKFTLKSTSKYHNGNVCFSDLLIYLLAIMEVTFVT